MEATPKLYNRINGMAVPSLTLVTLCLPKPAPSPSTVKYIQVHNSGNSYTENEVNSMLEFLIDNTFVKFGEHIFQQIVSIPMGANCATLLSIFS